MLDAGQLVGRRQMLGSHHRIVGTTFSYFLVLDSLELCLGPFNNVFIYLPAPPLVPTATVLASSIAKEWGTRPSESEKFYIADLDPFENMSFCPSRPSPVGNTSVPKGAHERRRSLGSSSSGSSPTRSRPSRKRVKVEVDTGPLDELIPPVLDDPSSRTMLHMLTKVH
jgi:hypothetical protein